MIIILILLSHYSSLNYALHTISKTTELVQIPECLPLPSGATSWDVNYYDEEKIEIHPIPARPKCLNPSDILRQQKPVLVSVFSPDFSQFTVKGFRIDKHRVKTSCKTLFFGSDDKNPISSSRKVLQSDDMIEIAKLCNNSSCLPSIEKLYVGTSMKYPHPEEYDCSWMSERIKETDLYIVSAISMQLDSSGSVTQPSLGQPCFTFNSSLCLQAQNHFAIVFPTVKIDPCKLELKIIAHGTISLKGESYEYDNSTFITIPDKKLRFWFSGDVYDHKVICNINGVELRESSDGYLIGLSDGVNKNADMRLTGIKAGAKNFLHPQATAVDIPIRRSDSITRHARNLPDNPVRSNQNVTMSYDYLQRSYTRAEIQYGLEALRQQIEKLKTDIDFELCKLRITDWDVAYSLILSNPSLMAQWIRPLDRVRGEIQNNMLRITRGTRIKDICIPYIPEFEGVHMRFMFMNEKYWLEATSGELSKIKPSYSVDLKLDSFVIPVNPKGYYDVMSSTYLTDETPMVLKGDKLASIKFSNKEMYGIQDVINWGVSHQTYQSYLMNDLVEKTSHMVGVKSSFNEWVAEPSKRLWKKMSSGMQDVTYWACFLFIIFLIIYVMSHIVVPIWKSKQKLKLKERSNDIREQALMQRQQITAF